MNTTNQLVAIVDIGTSQVVAMVGKQGPNKKVQIISYGTARSQGVRRGVILNVKEVVLAVKEAVENAEKHLNGGKIKKVYAGINGQRLRTVRKSAYYNLQFVDEITEEHIDYLIREVKSTSCASDEKVYRVIPQTYTVDDETGVRNPAGIRCKSITGYFNVIVGPRHYWDNLAEVMQKAGLELKGEIDIPSILGDSTLSKDETESGVAIFDLGAGATTMAIYHDGYLTHSATIPFGGEVITKDIKEGCQIPLETAELLKKKHGSAFVQAMKENKTIVLPKIGEFEKKTISAEMLTNIIQARLEEILDAIAYQFEESQETQQFSMGRGVGIVLIGGGANCTHVKELTEYFYGREVRIGYPRIVDEGKFKEAISAPEFSTAIGLLQKGIRSNMSNGGKNFVSFEKEEEIASPSSKPNNWWQKLNQRGKNIIESLENQAEDLK